MPDEESVTDTNMPEPGLPPPNNQPNHEGQPQSSDPQHCQGYQKLAQMMATYPASAMFRQFGTLNALKPALLPSRVVLAREEIGASREK